MRSSEQSRQAYRPHGCRVWPPERYPVAVTLFLASWEKPGNTAVHVAAQARQAGRDLRRCLEEGLIACELDPDYLAIGLGSLPNSDGELELDAAIMDGRNLEAGAVCGLKGIVPAISVARLVMDRTPHVMIAGDQARRFAIQHGCQPRQTMTEKSVRLYEEWRATGAHTHYVHSSADVAFNAEASHADTVTMLGLETTPEGPHFVAASSTSGLSWKIPGRVGDSPIIGAGIYADDEVGAAGATGHGEELWKACASFRTVELMRQGRSPREACEDTIRHMIRRQPNALQMASVVIAVNREGEFAAAINRGEFHLWSWTAAGPQVHVYQGLQP